MIYVTGDCHGDFRRFSTDIFPEQKEMSKDDYVIICGDFGLWHDTKEERYWLDWLNNKSFTTLFVDGNHENFDRLYSDEFETVDFHGGQVHKIRDTVLHLKRGHVFNLCGKKFWAFGGASSHDIADGILDRSNFLSDRQFLRTVKDWQRRGKQFRINHVSWWAEELPSQEEMDFGLKTLQENDNKVDFIITHCCPQYVASAFSNGIYKPDALTKYFNLVAATVEFDRWIFGHIHGNKNIMTKFIMLYEQIVRCV